MIGVTLPVIGFFGLSLMLILRQSTAQMVTSSVSDTSIARLTATGLIAGQEPVIPPK